MALLTFDYKLNINMSCDGIQKCSWCLLAIFQFQVIDPPSPSTSWCLVVATEPPDIWIQTLLAVKHLPDNKVPYV